MDAKTWASRCWSVGVAVATASWLLAATTVEAGTFSCTGGNVACLVAAMREAQLTPGPHTIRLAAGVYSVSTIDKASVRAGRTGYETRARSSEVLDVNDDGIPDRRFGFLAERLGLTGHSSRVSLTAVADNGASVAGTTELEPVH